MANIFDNSLCVIRGQIIYLMFERLYTCCRGASFHQPFAEIGTLPRTLRSIIPKSVKVLALTSTATKATVDCIMKRLFMKDPIIIGVNTDRSI